MDKKKIAKLLADMAELKNEAETLGHHEAATDIETAMNSIYKLALGVHSYIVTKLSNYEWQCEFLIDGQRDTERFGTYSTGCKVFGSRYAAERAGRQYVAQNEIPL